MRRLWPLAAVAFAVTGCGAARHAEPAPVPRTPPAARPQPPGLPAAAKQSGCTAGKLVRLGSAQRAYAAAAPNGAVAYRRPGGAELARFGPRNVNDYPTFFGVVGKVLRRDCGASWYRVELPIKPNGITGYVRASEVRVQPVTIRIVVDVRRRVLTLYRRGKPLLQATVAVGAPSTPTPLGRFYVNQRLVPDDPTGPFGPGALGISAYSEVLTGWVQGGPVAIHGTNEPWSVGHAVSNGCIRLPNRTLERIWRLAVAGTPVIIEA